MTGIDSASQAAPSRKAMTVRWLGRIFAPIVAIVVYLILTPTDVPPVLTEEGRVVAAVGVLLGLLWMTEAMPLFATALLPIVLFPIFGVVTTRQAAAPYGHPLIFLFLGGFIIALCMEKWGLHKRIALLTLEVVGAKPGFMIGGFMIATAFLSMWLSNTATTVMMLPIATSVIALVAKKLEDDADGEKETERFATALLLGVAYSATIGGVGTIIGTPPNAMLAANMDELFEYKLGFGAWMLAAVPIAVIFLALTWLLLVKILYRFRIREIPGGRELVHTELKSLGPMSRGECVTLCVFLFTAFLWIARKPLQNWDWLVAKIPLVVRLDDTIIALMGALLLFAIPVYPKRAVFTMDWRTAERLPWGVLLLFGGGLSLAGAVNSTGLDKWIGGHVHALDGVSILVLIVVVTSMIVFLTELTSNTATAATFLPLLAGVAIGLRIDPLLLMVPAAMGASCAFMMPVATPPNAIVFGSGRLRIGQMISAGFWLNLLSITFVTVAMYTTVMWALGVQFEGIPEWAQDEMQAVETRDP